MRLRAATLHDAPELAKIMGDWFDVTPFVPRLHTPAEDVQFVSNLIETQDVLVSADALVAGFVARDGAQIGQLYVAEEARNRGVGSLLLNAMKARAPQLWLWCFQANTGARRFYARHGFAVDKTTDGSSNEEKLPDVRYAWRQQE